MHEETSSRPQATSFGERIPKRSHRKDLRTKFTQAKPFNLTDPTVKVREIISFFLTPDAPSTAYKQTSGNKTPPETLTFPFPIPISHTNSALPYRNAIHRCHLPYTRLQSPRKGFATAKPRPSTSPHRPACVDCPGIRSWLA